MPTDGFATAPGVPGQMSFLRVPMHRDPPNGPHPTAILGVPFDMGTRHRPGSRFGPTAIRQATHTLASGDSVAQDVNVKRHLTLFDAGDTEIIPGAPEASLHTVQREATRLLSAGCHLVTLGGDHTISLPLLRAHAAHVGGPLALVQFDAHPDTWEGAPEQPVYHGSPFRIAIEEGLIDPARTVQIGIRSPVGPAVRDWTLAQGVTQISAEDVHLNGIAWTVDQVVERIGAAACYLTFDLDVLDPAQAPGTSTPELGGLWAWQALALLRRLNSLAFVGADVVECSPPYDHAELTALAGATVAFTYLGLRARRAAGL